MRSLLLVAKPVSWTLDPDRPRKTGSRYNDTVSCFGNPKGSVTMSQKVTVLFDCLLGYFWQKPHWGYFYPPPSLPGEGLITVFLARLRLEHFVVLRLWLWLQFPAIIQGSHAREIAVVSMDLRVYTKPYVLQVQWSRFTRED